MRTYSTIIAICLVFLLTGCGGKKLSFKNSDAVIKSYKSVTAKLSEAERVEFRRNMFLIAWTSDKPDTEVSVSDIQTAWNYERNTHDLTGPDATAIAKELAIRGVSKMDGKTVAQVNQLGDKLSSIAVDAKVKSIEAQMGSLDAAVKQLTQDKQAWRDRKQKAANAEAALVKDTKKYSPKIISKETGKNWRGIVLTGKVSLSSPHKDPINDYRNTFTVAHKGHVARYKGIRGQSNAYRKDSAFNLSLTPSSFINEQGESLPKDYVMPMDISAYELTVRPTWVRTSGKAEGWKTHEYKLDQELTKALYNLPAALKSCDQGIENAQKIRGTYETQIQTLKVKKFDDLKRIYGRYAESCI